MICPACDGKGQSLCHVNTGFDSSKHRWEMIACGRCGGYGQLNDEWVARGLELRRVRHCLGLSLLEASKVLRCTPAAVSAMELGKRQPADPSALQGGTP